MWSNVPMFKFQAWEPRDDLSGTDKKEGVAVDEGDDGLHRLAVQRDVLFLGERGVLTA
jgi:hypothetical protein